jgi:hypothetical protein
MSTRFFERSVLAAAIALAVASTLHAAAEPKNRVAVDFKRDPKVAIHREDAPPPSVPDMPGELRVPTPRADAPRVEASRAPVPPGGAPDVDGLAVKAADEVAIEAARVWGWRQYWRAGFGRGARAALNDDRLGGWDRAEGFRFGRFDPRARELGESIAADAAGPDAERAASDQVRAQFTDLTREPVNDPRSRAPRFAPDGPWASAPEVGDVLVVVPLAATPGLSRPAREAIERWDGAPAAFARDDRAASVYDGSWKDPIVAFGVWRDRQRSGSYWSRFASVDKERFRGTFCDRFEWSLEGLDLRPTYAGWNEGFEDGWRYGATVRAEWNYRQGYAEGFDLGVREVASAAYPYAFERAYAGGYAAAFDDWQRHPHPAIGAVRLTDESGDGVFEPGERVIVIPEIVNYGGAAGSADLRAAGGDLDGEAVTTVRLPARGRASLDREFVVTVDARTPSRTHTAVTLTLGDARSEAPLYVSRPLAIDGEPEIESDRLAGRVSLTVAVANTSRRDVAASARVEPQRGPGDPQVRDLGVLKGGRSTTATFTYDGFAPLDLIAGDARFQISVARGADPDDVTTIAIAAVATDLASRDLLDFMIGLAKKPHAPRGDVERARGLMLERMRADWEHACAADGNPYKRDLESGGTETALGELARSVDAERRSLTSRAVFDGLGDQISTLADDLPGAHPLLRKWMKKLAKRVG